MARPTTTGRSAAPTGRVFPAGTGGNPTTAQLGRATDLAGTTAQPAIRQNPETVQKTVVPFTDSGVPGFVDGSGNRIWHVDSSASAQAIVFTSAAESTDFSYVVKWVKGTNPLTMSAASGNVNGTTTFAGVTVGDAYEFRSDGTDYQLVSRVGDFAVSGGPAAFSNLTVGGSATFSGTVAFLTAANISGSLSVGTLVVSGTASFSGTVVMNSLKVLGSATFSSDVYVRGSLNVSATASVGALTIGGAPLTADWVKLASASIANVLSITISGSWSAYTAIRVEAFYGASAGVPNPQLQLSTDNGASYFLAGNVITPASGTSRWGSANAGVTTNTYSGVTRVHCAILTTGINGTPGTSYITGEALNHNGRLKTGAGNFSLTGVVGVMNYISESRQVTATANSAIVNQLSFAHRNNATTVTISTGVLLVFGMR